MDNTAVFGTAYSSSSLDGGTTLNPIIVRSANLLARVSTTQSKNTKKSVISGFFAVILGAMCSCRAKFIWRTPRKSSDFLILTIATFFISLWSNSNPESVEFFSEGVRFLIANFNDFF